MSTIEIKPDYYDDFHCIGGECSFTCCQEWKISVDRQTKKKWRSVTAPGDLKQNGRLPSGLSEHSSLSQFIKKVDDTDVIGLLPDMKCPFLDCDHLCRLVKEHGEEMLSVTCHEFPRENHAFPDRTEKALVSCCPEIVDRWNEKETLNFTGLDYKDGEALKCGSVNDILKLTRDLMMFHLSDESSDNRTNLLTAFFILLDIYNKDSIDDIKDYTDPESIIKLKKSIKKLERNEEDSMNERNELFLDITENYSSEGRYTGFLKPLREASLSFLYDNTDKFNELLSTYEKLLRNYLVSETFSNLLIPGMDLRDMVLQFEWMMMEYASILQALYLTWTMTPDHKLTYESVRDMIVLISRLTGYDASDIEEYLTNSFESPVWDFGYADFLLG
ncbi:flagellin lysine-N-methylase [Oribacterium sp. P6A1]|uniref:flagellin lysine-N-methylase n=1 Tax=Oribacterium sp. P6A1 TaxID=1410612 RepID=UPI00055C3F72|nr:flagellin lysine-N-methylase [Oribacterium sp. P6A1]